MVIAEEVPCTSTVENCNGFVIVGDNIDKNVRPSFQRADRKTESWHCFHSYAVYNRVNVSKLSDSMPSGEVSVTSVLPNKQDLQKIFKDFEVLISRYLYMMSHNCILLLLHSRIESLSNECTFTPR